MLPPYQAAGTRHPIRVVRIERLTQDCRYQIVPVVPMTDIRCYLYEGSTHNGTRDSQYLSTQVQVRTMVGQFYKHLPLEEMHTFREWWTYHHDDHVVNAKMDLVPASRTRLSRVRQSGFLGDYRTGGRGQSCVCLTIDGLQKYLSLRSTLRRIKKGDINSNKLDWIHDSLLPFLHLYVSSTSLPPPSLPLSPTSPTSTTSEDTLLSPSPHSPLVGE